MREQVIGGFSAQLKDIFREAKESYSTTKTRVEEAFAAAQQTAAHANDTNGQVLFANGDVVDMGRSPPLLRRAAQTVGSVLATFLLVGGLACLGAALFQLMAAFFVMTQLLGLRFDLDGAGAVS